MTDFEKKVLKVVCAIPLGETRSYKWVACKVGSPRSWRAVANALKKNPYPFFIPCHRVVKSSRDSGGYSLGKGLKKELINFEKRVRDVIQ
ncbi:MAG: methylated-DNA--[protein]-cysteine S-methyltransferase [Candidatus Omnitrophica bacterium]|nr:methylated-DNA--[protein]-cysteine S-methyltransferase [Candidatus Omnitrophota bacterium]MBD3269120.1 methylated-DNA--[protein]-cysteine S-methyltransferase [Candidatus Omnitrophota bacterium]